jgi:hypothetical protein
VPAAHGAQLDDDNAPVLAKYRPEAQPTQLTDPVLGW